MTLRISLAGLTYTLSFPVHRVVGRCRKCMKLDNDARLRHDFSQYRAMLKELRRSEESFEDGSKIAYLLQVETRMMNLLFLHASVIATRESVKFVN